MKWERKGVKSGLWSVFALECGRSWRRITPGAKNAVVAPPLRPPSKGVPLRIPFIRADCESNGLFRCAIGHPCIPGSWKCDGDNDCIDGSDETTALCGTSRRKYKQIDLFSLFLIIECDGPNKFHCGSGECIATSSVCDGKRDCFDNSDETPPNCCKKIYVEVI